MNSDDDDDEDQDDSSLESLFLSDSHDGDEGLYLNSNVLLAIALAAAGDEFDDGNLSNRTYHVRDRIEWDLHVSSLLNEGNDSFQRMYQMHHKSFTKLCTMLHPLLTVDEHMSRLRTSNKSPISTEIALHCLIRWLAGRLYLDIRVAAGISCSPFYCCVHRAMTAILATPELEICLPATEVEFAEISKGFEEISATNRILNGCVGVLDGYLIQTTTVSRAEVGNVKAYFSGHYQCFGVNVQGMVDSKHWFIFLAAAAPGGTNNIVAFQKCTHLMNYIEHLLLGQYVIGDNAYVCSKHILTPFAGVERNDLRKDAYNFYVSQLQQLHT